jgi:hypothetical protein
MLELRSEAGRRVVAMSGTARQSLTGVQREIIEENAMIVSADIDVVECSAGGSVRCMLAELHLPMLLK